MSKDYYFHKWKETLKHLKALVDVDIHYQVTKVHDPTLPQAVLRLTSILGQYMLVYNDAIECFQQNLQVQKTVYYDKIVKAIVSRILELKSQLEKLEGSRFQFIGYGLIEVHHALSDIEMTAIPKEPGRPEHIQAELDQIWARVKEKKKTAMVNNVKVQVLSLDNLHNSEETIEEVPQEKVDIVPEPIRQTREYLAMILAHEKTRQVIKSFNHSKLKREIWGKELTGRLPPPARYEVRERSAQLIRKVFRAYFELKRERIKNCKRDELLGLNICDTRNRKIQRIQAEEMLKHRSKLHDIYKKEWLARREQLKQELLKNKRDKLCEEFRDQIREWFIEWFESVQFFYDIPKVGSAPIFKAEVPSPYEWLEENKALTIKFEADKKKNTEDLKFEKKEAKRQKMLLKKEEQMKLKAEAQLLKKIMKDPNMHPGYHFPLSKQTGQLLEVIDYYHKAWDMYDVWETLDVKVKYVHKVDLEDALVETKLEVLPEADEEMRQELRQLKHALKEDYKANEEEMPVNLMKPIKGERKKKKNRKHDINAEVVQIIVDLIEQGFMIEYARNNIENFTGDANFGGEDLRSQILPAFPFNFEIRAYWWERCHEVCLGFRRILLAGPKRSGKTVLVHALASLNDAVLFELDPHKVQGDMRSPEFLKRLLKMVVTCAKALQPSVIHIKHVQKLFYAKIPPEEAELNLPLLKTFFVQKLMKKIHKNDKITIVGTCTDPWLAKASVLLKQFPTVLVLPDCTYSVVVQILKEWVVKHQVIPASFNVSNLAYVLQGYSFGYLKEVLDKFMSADRIVKIAVFGLDPIEVYDFILKDDKGTKDYDMYHKWYTEKTSSGMKEMQHLKEQREFKAAVKKFEEKKKKKAKSAPRSTTSHTELQ